MRHASPLSRLYATITLPIATSITKIEEKNIKYASIARKEDITLKKLTTIPSIFIIYNSTKYCTILILQLHIITYDLLLHVSTLMRHLQGALCTLYSSICNLFHLYLYSLYVQPPRKELAARYTTNIS